MKRLIFTAIICAAATGVFAQNADTLKVDTATTTHKSKKFKFSIGDGEGYNVKHLKDTDETKRHSKAPGFTFGLTFSRFDLGLATLIDNGSFTLSPQNQFLRYRSWKTSNVGFDVIQFGYRFNSSFKIYISGGFDWTHIRLRDNITILRDQPVLTYRQDDIDYSKNRFSSSYLRVPLSFDYRSKQNDDGRSFHLVFGPEVGFLLNGRVKQISEENGKQKFNDTYHYATFRYGPFIRVGEGAWGLYAKYYMNDMFENSPDQKGLKNFSFGITFGW